MQLPNHQRLSVVPVVPFSLIVHEDGVEREIMTVTSWPALPAVGDHIVLSGITVASQVASGDLGRYVVIDRDHRLSAEDAQICVFARRIPD